MQPNSELQMPQQCPVCQQIDRPVESQEVRCNVRRYRDRVFQVWRCGRCRSLHCEAVQNLPEYYRDYPIRGDRLDYFLRTWYRVILRRLIRAGLRKTDRIIDYGCNSGLFLDFLRENGYSLCVGYDPYVEEFKATDILDVKYDFVLSLDVIEHDMDPADFLSRLSQLLGPGGRLCLGTPNADGIDLSSPEEYLHSLHVPYHVHILSSQALTDLVRLTGLEPIAVYHRWYMDSWLPGTSRRLIEALLRYAGNDLDAGYEPPRMGLFLKHPVLLFYLLFGYFLPSKKNDNIMMILAAKAGPQSPSPGSYIRGRAKS